MSSRVVNSSANDDREIDKIAGSVPVDGVATAIREVVTMDISAFSS